MKLMTAELERKFASYPLYSQDGKGLDAEVVVKYFNPFGSGTWLITEGQKQADGDWLLFGYCHVHCWEWGEVLLSELEGLPMIERDLYSSGTVKEMM